MGSSRTLIAFLQNPVVAVVQATSILHCINEYVFGITTCAGPSMMPTFNMSGDVIFVEKLSSRNGTLSRGDVVIAMTPQNAKLKVCKRIIGLQGETVMVPSRTWFNGERPEFVPPGHVWLEGDNATNSTDSRAYGPIPLAMIRGRVFYKAWPPTEMGPVRRRVPEQASPVLVNSATEISDGGIRVQLMAADGRAQNSRRQDPPGDGSSNDRMR
ncbi:unnamed protein product [Ascophyllum nodosum]